MNPDVVVVGGGLIGLACAWRAAQAGLQVTVVDPTPGTGASHVAAGMLAPVTEAAYGEEDHLALTIASARAWPAFAAELEAATGVALGYRAEGTLLVGFDTDDMAVLDDLQRFQTELGLEVTRLRARACRDREPLLSPRVRGGLATDEDHRVEPRRVVDALLHAVDGAGVTLLRDRVASIDQEAGRVTGVTLASGAAIGTAAVVLAAGSWSAEVGGLPPELAPPVRPVKGQLLILRDPAGGAALSTTVRGIVRGRSVYLVPRDDGHVVVGATQEERGFDTTVTAGAVRELLTDAASIVPGVDEFELVEAIAGLRPATPDNRPLIGASALEGLVFATGHHRGGVLLAPVTAAAVAAVLTGEEPDPVVAVADPGRPALARTATRTTTEASP